ncbi:hypothetical protein CGRA01v4_01150 [Colletotrichum graminicola]|nr:hypothetical protein CGRA01v4_01150 [Colletotrichum graminicola]
MHLVFATSGTTLHRCRLDDDSTP